MGMKLSRLLIIFVFFLPLYKTYGEITFSEQFDTLPSNFTTTYYGGSTASDFERNTIDDALNILTVGSRAESEIVMKYEGNINSADYDTSGGIVYFTVLAGNSADVAEGSTYFDNDGDLTYTNVAEACLQFSNFNGDGEVILLNENGNKRISYSNENYIDVGSIDSVYLRLSYNFNTDIYGEYYSYDGVNFILLNEQYAPNDDFSIVIGAYSKLTEFEQGDIYFDNFVISDSIEYNINNNTGTDLGNTDTDGDGLSDADEVNTYFTDPNDIDSDNDGIADAYDPSPLSYDSSTNVPASLNGYVEIFFSDNYPGYGIWYGFTENDSINILYNGTTEYRFQDSYTWNSENLTSTGYFRTNFKNKTNDLFFKFTYVVEQSDSGRGFFYDGRIDLDNNGMADGEQITNGLLFPAADSIIDLANVYSSAESNLIPIQVLDYASNEKYFPSELRDLRAGSTMIAVENGTATLSMEVEQSDDLEIWTSGGTTNLQVPVDPNSDTKFFRFKMAE